MARQIVEGTIKRVGAAKGRREFMMIDTGSSYTVVSRILATDLRLEIDPTVREKLRVANTTLIIMPAEVDILLKGSDCMAEGFNAWVVVSDNDLFIPVLLGVDFLQLMGAQVDFRQGRHGIACAPHQGGSGDGGVATGKGMSTRDLRSNPRRRR